MADLTPIGAVRGYQSAGNTLIFDCGAAHLRISLLAPRLVRVRAAPNGRFAPHRSWAVAPDDDAFPETLFKVTEDEQCITIATTALQVRVERDPCQVSFSTVEGQSFFADAPGFLLGRGEARCTKQIDYNEHFFGFGQRSGLLDKHGRRLTNWTTDPLPGHGTGTDPLYIAIPVFMGVRPGLAYGVFFNTTRRSSFDVGDADPLRLTMTNSGDELDYYLIAGPTPPEVTVGLAALLGTMPLPPRWALGYHQSRWGYRSDDEMRALAHEFRTRDMPCDTIHFDIDYMHGYRVFTWHPERFPDPAGLIASVRREGFKVVTIIDPGVKRDPDYHVYREGMERDAFIRRADGELFHGYVWPDDSAFADFTRRDVREWWGDLVQGLTDLGVQGIWNDMNEPTVFDRPFSEGGGNGGTIDLDAPQGPEGERTTHAEVHNLYALQMAQATYDGLRRHVPERRPFILTRSAYAGIQRYAACWMGDNSSWWEHLEMTMPQLMGMGLSGVPFVGVDIGGFFGNATPELFARWMQLGILLPFCRGHSYSESQPHEPWRFGPVVEQICRDYLKLRYRLLPYLYTLFHQAATDGTPILRPLFYHFHDDEQCYSISDQVLLGPALLAAPICRPGTEYRHLYLPEGGWYDWWSGDLVEGPAHLLEHAPLERLPLFARSGAFVPLGPAMAYSDQRPLDRLTLLVFPGDGDFTLYEDEGDGFAYQQGRFCTTTFSQRRNGTTLKVNIAARQGAYTPPPRTLVLEVYGVDADAAQRYPGATYDEERGTLMIAIQDEGVAHEFTFAVGGG